LLEVVRQLPAFDKQLALLYLEGLTGREMEEVTGISANNVAVRLSRVRQRLAASLRPKEVRR
jgi:RNA polymerase sigma-70 factor (ECF subfamily)